MEGLVAGLGRTTVVFTGDTESVVENLQLRQQKQKGRGGGKQRREESKRKKQKVRMSPRKKGGGKYAHHKYSQGQHLTLTAAAAVSSAFCPFTPHHSTPLALVGEMELMPNKLRFRS